jgi:hypothetical protein
MSELGKEKEVTLLELLDRMIDRGVVLTGDLTISVAEVDLVSVAINVVLASTERMSELAAGR